MELIHHSDSDRYELDEFRDFKKVQDDSPLAKENITNQIIPFLSKEICEMVEEALFKFTRFWTCKCIYNYIKAR